MRSEVEPFSSVGRQLSSLKVGCHLFVSQITDCPSDCLTLVPQISLQDHQN